VSSYLTLSPFTIRKYGSLLSVALALGLPQPSVRWNLASLQPGLSSGLRQQSPAVPEEILYHKMGKYIANCFVYDIIGVM